MPFKQVVPLNSEFMISYVLLNLVCMCQSEYSWFDFAYIPMYMISICLIIKYLQVTEIRFTPKIRE